MKYPDVTGEIRDYTLHGEDGGQGIREHTGKVSEEVILFIDLVINKTKERCTFIAAWEIEAREHIKITYN